jgi:hypothetical protein
VQRILTIATALALVATAGVGLVDAIRDGRGDAAVLFGLILVGVGLLAGLRASSTPIVLRRDLAAWIERTSATTGETPAALTNRAVSRLRADVGDRPRDDG